MSTIVSVFEEEEDQENVPESNEAPPPADSDSEGSSPGDLDAPMLGDDFQPPPRSRVEEVEDEDAPPSKRARVEEVDDEEAPRNARYPVPYPGRAGEPLDKQETMFHQMQEEQKLDGDEDNPWAPFDNQDEWELGRWLMKNVGQKKTNEFLQLPIVSYRRPSLYVS